MKRILVPIGYFLLPIFWLLLGFFYGDIKKYMDATVSLPSYTIFYLVVLVGTIILTLVVPNTVNRVLDKKIVYIVSGFWGCVSLLSLVAILFFLSGKGLPLLNSVLMVYLKNVNNPFGIPSLVLGTYAYTFVLRLVSKTELNSDTNTV